MRSQKKEETKLSEILKEECVHFCLAFVALLASIISGAVLASSIGHVRFTHGEVRLFKMGESSHLKQNTQLAAGDIIRTGADSYAIIVTDDGSTFRLEENAQIKINELIVQGQEEEFAGKTDLVLQLGSIFVEVVRKFSGPPSVMVKNEKGVALGVRGTEFFAGIDPESQDFIASVAQGEVAVMDEASDDHENVKAGESIVVENGRKLSRPYAYEWGKQMPWGKKNWQNMNSSSSSKKFRFKEMRQKIRHEYRDKMAINGPKQRQRKPFMKEFRQQSKMQGRFRNPKNMQEIRQKIHSGEMPQRRRIPGNGERPRMMRQNFQKMRGQKPRRR